MLDYFCESQTGTCYLVAKLYRSWSSRADTTAHGISSNDQLLWHQVLIPHCSNCVTKSGEDGAFHPIPHIEVETVDSVSVHMHCIGDIPPVWAFTVTPQIRINLIIRRALKGNNNCLMTVDDNTFAAPVDGHAGVDIDDG